MRICKCCGAQNDMLAKSCDRCKASSSVAFKFVQKIDEMTQCNACGGELNISNSPPDTFERHGRLPDDWRSAHCKSCANNPGPGRADFGLYRVRTCGCQQAVGLSTNKKKVEYPCAEHGSIKKMVGQAPTAAARICVMCLGTNAVMKSAKAGGDVCQTCNLAISMFKGDRRIQPGKTLFKEGESIGKPAEDNNAEEHNWNQQRVQTVAYDSGQALPSVNTPPKTMNWQNRKGQLSLKKGEGEEEVVDEVVPDLMEKDQHLPGQHSPHAFDQSPHAGPGIQSLDAGQKRMGYHIADPRAVAQRQTQVAAGAKGQQRPQQRAMAMKASDCSNCGKEIGDAAFGYSKGKKVCYSCDKKLNKSAHIERDCPTCGATPMRSCIDPATGMEMGETHATRAPAKPDEHYRCTSCRRYHTQPAYLQAGPECAICKVPAINHAQLLEAEKNRKTMEIVQALQNAGTLGATALAKCDIRSNWCLKHLDMVTRGSVCCDTAADTDLLIAKAVEDAVKGTKPIGDWLDKGAGSSKRSEHGR